MLNQLDFSIPDIYSIRHQGQFIGIVNSKGKITFFESHPKDLIRVVGGGFGVLPQLFIHPQIQEYHFIYENKLYKITKEKFYKVYRKANMSDFVKIAANISHFTVEDTKQLSLFDMGDF